MIQASDSLLIVFNPSRLDNRGVLRGVQCVCGQWWPDFVGTESARQFRTECCGALYQLETGTPPFQSLNLIERPAHLGADVPTESNTLRC